MIRKHYAAADKAATASARAGTPPIPVVAGKVVRKNVPIYLDGLGTVQAFNTVTVHVRVDGQLKKVAFVEGQDVHQGDLLAQIDPDPYQAQLAQAIAKKAQDEAQLANARLDLKREADLFAAKIDSQQAFDTQQALVNQLQAAVKADDAAIESAQVQVSYTTVTSPIDGRTGIRLVDQGNIVHATDANGLVMITQLHPISVVFTLPEQHLSGLHKEMSSGELNVLAVDRDNSTILDEGKLAVIDNQIDTTTGTIKLKATFPNNSLKLWPGQFVNARLLLTTVTNGAVVPAAAIQPGPEGDYVFMIEDGKGGAGKNGTPGNAGHQDGASKRSAPSKPDNENNPGGAEAARKAGGNKGGSNGNDGQDILTVRVQPVTSIPVDAGEALVTKGLSPGERIVVEGQYKLQAGSRVRLASAAKVAEGDSESADSTQ